LYRYGSVEIPAGAFVCEYAGEVLTDAVRLCTLNQVDPYPITYDLSNP
jgi:hypothetical protein